MLIGLLLTFTAKYETIKVAVGFSQFTENFYREFFSIFRNISHTITAHLLLTNPSSEFYNSRLLFLLV